MRRIIWLVFITLLATFVIIIGHLPQYPCGLSSIILNILQGAYASTLVVIFFEFIKEYRLYVRLNFLDGDWEEFGIKDRFLVGPIAKGVLTYHGGNVIHIELFHDTRKWTGEIIVDKDYPHIGTVSWAYVPDAEQEHEFGLKEIIIPTERNKTDKKYYYFYLLPVNHSMNLLGELHEDRKIVLNGSAYDKVVWRKLKQNK